MLRSAIGDLADLLRNVSRETWRLYNKPIVSRETPRKNAEQWSNKSHLHWVYGGLAVSRGTLFYAASRLAMCFTWNVGRSGWVVGGWFLRTVFLPLLPRSWCFTWNRRIVGSSFWLLEECGSTSLSVIMRDCFLVIRFLWVYLLGVRVSLGGFHRRGFVLWLLSGLSCFTWNILLNYRWTSGTYSNLFVGMIEAYSATGKIYLH